MSVDTLRVSLYDQPIGRLVRRSGGSTFYPDPAWANAGFLPRLGLGWDLKGGSGERHAHTHLPEWFENLLPEPEGALRSRQAKALGLQTTASFALLAVLGGDLPGAVVVTPEGRVLNDLQDPTGTRLPPTQFSLAGMQLKFSVAVKNQRIVLPVDDERGHWILKLPTGDVRGIAEIEHTTMAWASAAGFDVPDHRTVRIADVSDFATLASTPDERAFLIRRFDRGDGDVRVHQEDLAQVYEVGSIHKYANEGWRRTSYDAVARLIRDACGEEQLREFIRRLVFVIASGNTDAHLKNWSLLHPQGMRPRLAPLYDQVCVIAWDTRYGWGHLAPPTLALGLGGSRTLGDLTLRRFSGLAQRTGMLESEMVNLVRDTLDRIWTAWERVDAPDDMRRAVAHHCRRVPLLG